jgi:hypothetical protein
MVVGQGPIWGGSAKGGGEYAICFDLYLGHHQANSIKHKLSYFE